MSLILLIRHAVTDETGKRLYGTSPGVHLSEVGKEQALGLVGRLEGVQLSGVWASPLERCLETAEHLAASRGLPVGRVRELGEVDYGRLTGRPFADLRRTALWRRLRAVPSSVRFPGGETLAEVQARVVGALARLAERPAREAVAVVTHGDPIRLALAHFAGIPIDLCQRLHVDPASVSALEVGDAAPRILRVNDTGSLRDLAPPSPRRVRR